MGQFPKNEQMSMVAPGTISRSNFARAGGAGWLYHPFTSSDGTTITEISSQPGEIGSFLKLVDVAAAPNRLIKYPYLERFPSEDHNDLATITDPAGRMFDDSPSEVYLEFEMHNVYSGSPQNNFFRVSSRERIDSTDTTGAIFNYASLLLSSGSVWSYYRNSLGGTANAVWSKGATITSGTTYTIRIYYKASTKPFKAGDSAGSFNADGVYQIWVATGSMSQNEFHSSGSLTFNRVVDIHNHTGGEVEGYQFMHVTNSGYVGSGSNGFRCFSTFTDGKLPSGSGSHSNTSSLYTDTNSWTDYYCSWMGAFYDDGQNNTLAVKVTGFHDQRLHAATGAFPGSSLTGRFRVYTNADLQSGNEVTSISSAATNIEPFGESLGTVGTDNADAFDVQHFLHTHELTGFLPNANYWIVFERVINDGTSYTHRSKPIVIKTPSVPGGTPSTIEFIPISCTHRDRMPTSPLVLLGEQRINTSTPSVHTLASHTGDLGYHDDQRTVQRGTSLEQDGAQSTIEFSETFCQMMTCHTMMKFMSTCSIIFIGDDHEVYDNVTCIPMESDVAVNEFWQNGGEIFPVGTRPALGTATPPLNSGTKRGYTISPRDVLRNAFNAAKLWTQRSVPTSAELSAISSNSRKFNPIAAGALNWGDGVTAYADDDGFSRSFDYADTRVVVFEGRRFREKISISNPPVAKVISGGPAGIRHEDFFHTGGSGGGIFDDASSPKNLVLVLPQPVSDVHMRGSMHHNESYGDWNPAREERNRWLREIEHNASITSVFSMCGDFHMISVSDHHFHKCEKSLPATGRKWVAELVNGAWGAGGQNDRGMGWERSKPKLLTTRNWYFDPTVTSYMITSATISGSVITFTTSTTNNYAAGDVIRIELLLPSAYSDDYTISAIVNSTTFTCTRKRTPSGNSTNTGTVIRAAKGNCRSTSIVTLNESAQTYSIVCADGETSLDTYYSATLSPPTSDPVDLTQGLVSAYAFDSDGTDYTESQNYLTVVGTPSFVSGLVDGAVQLNNGHTGDWLERPLSELGGYPAANRPFSVFVWIKFDTYEQWRDLLSVWIASPPDANVNMWLLQSTSASFRPLAKYLENDGWATGLADEADTTRQLNAYVSGDANMNPLVWNWLEFSFDPTEGRIYLGWNNLSHIDVTDQSTRYRPLLTGLNQWRPGDTSPMAPFHLGSTSLKASFCQLLIYNRFLPLQGAERAKIYNSGSGLPLAFFEIDPLSPDLMWSDPTSLGARIHRVHKK